MGLARLFCCVLGVLAVGGMQEGHATTTVIAARGWKVQEHRRRVEMGSVSRMDDGREQVGKDEEEQEDHETNTAEETFESVVAKLEANGVGDEEVAEDDLSGVEVLGGSGEDAEYGGGPGALQAEIQGKAEKSRNAVDSPPPSALLDTAASPLVQPSSPAGPPAVKMMSCGGAPESMVPFVRNQSPWKDNKQFIGVLAPKIKPSSRHRRQLLDSEPWPPVSGGFPSAQEFDGWLELMGAEAHADTSAMQGSTLLSFISRALKEDRRRDPFRMNETDDADRVFLGPRALQVLHDLGQASDTYSRG
eukprot:CAMPEP_0117651358 /NCGR_PEP_ID=MMETSP0804-20121206/2049_1 /TAXON_ID=1074897 /ORGANISM="Tetraselmis astigmatica, Strain CCMP880" /LENGTH=303 /DNA_ID=CAMNT_0005457329 /DNA_START=116 /DNA_END=1024 /DNA_ORIENTATION=-